MSVYRPEWLIWSSQHRAWWRPCRSGYTPYANEAGLYTMTEANVLCMSRAWGLSGPPETMLHRDSVPPEVWAINRAEVEAEQCSN